MKKIHNTVPSFIIVYLLSIGSIFANTGAQLNSGTKHTHLKDKTTIQKTSKQKASTNTIQRSNPYKKSNKPGVKSSTKYKSRLRTIPVSKNLSFDEIKHYQTKKKLELVEKAKPRDYKTTKQRDSNQTNLDTSDFNEHSFASIDFSADNKEADYYDNKTLEQVKLEIANTDKPYILYFGANWCIPCRLMRETVFKAHDVKKYLSQFYITYVDVDNFNGMDIKEMYKVKNIPFMVILDTQGKQIGRIEGSITSTSFSEKLKNYLLQ